MSTDAVYPPWPKVRASLEAVRWDELERALLQAYREREEHPSWVAAWLQPAGLRQHELLGVWIASGGPALGDERVSSWCWCHSYAQCFAGRSDEEGVRALMVELRAIWAWYDAARVHLEALSQRWRGERDDEEVVAQVVREAVEFVVMQGINDAWYSLIEPVVQWSFEVCGIFLSEAQFERCVEAPIERYFRSWVEPSREDIIAFGDEVAFAAVLTLFEQLYPSQDTSDSES